MNQHSQGANDPFCSHTSLLAYLETCKTGEQHMTIARFNELNVTEQLRLTMRHDQLIGHRSEGPKSMHLYAVEDFYVEVIYTTRRKEVLHVYAFADELPLEPYLRQIDISELFW